MPKDDREHLDPEYVRWRKKYRRFPGVAECFRVLHGRNVNGALKEIIECELIDHASECLQELIDVYRSEDDDYYRRYAFWAIAKSRLPEAIPFLAEVAKEPNDFFSEIAMDSLAEINTKESRTVLWELNKSGHRPRAAD
jgi:HEAT repeat protein